MTGSQMQSEHVPDRRCTFPSQAGQAHLQLDMLQSWLRHLHALLDPLAVVVEELDVEAPRQLLQLQMRELALDPLQQRL